MRFAVVVAGATLAMSAAHADTETRQVAEQLRDRGLAQSTAWTLLESLTTEIGARPVGSAAMARAKDWGLARLSALGLQQVHAEEFVKENAWFRGAESAEVTTPYPHALAILGLGNSVPTPPGGIEAEIALFSSFDELVAAPMGSLTGRIAVLNQPITGAQGEDGYHAAARGRREGPSIAAARGAVAFLMRSASTSASRLPHTGITVYAADVPRIPAAALGVPDAELLERLSARGGPVRARLALASTVVAQTPAWNVVGEIVGRESPREVIVIGGHLDSWDVAESATDDGAGVAICAAAAQLIAELPPRPRRTIRVVLWGSEETATSGTAYAEMHRNEFRSMVVAGESDLGAARIHQIALSRGDWTDPRLVELGGVLAPLNILVGHEPAVFGGTDIEDLRKAGVPVVRFSQDARHYFDFHHSADDTLNKVDRNELNQNVAAWAVFLYVIAESGVDLRPAKSDGALRLDAGGV
jgi:Zn-dependent M28 family amino/carboxypeptidase